MKKKLINVLALFALLGTMHSCEWFDGLVNITFETDYVDIDFTVNPNTAGEHELAEKVLQSDIEQQIEEHGGNAVNLDEIRVYDATLSIETEGVTFDAFNWVEVYISAEGAEEILIGTATITETGLLSVDLDITEEDLSDIIDAESYNVRIVGSLAEELVAAVDMLLRIRYQVVV